MKDISNSEYYFWDKINGLQSAVDTTFINSVAVSYLQMPDPETWPETIAKWNRDPEYMGMFSTVSDSFTFVLDAANVLNAVYLNEWIEGRCYLRVQICRDLAPGYTYDDLYIAPINFNNFSPLYMSDGSKKITVSLYPNELSRLLKAYGDTEYNIMMYKNEGTPTIDPDVIPIYTDGVKVTAAFNFVSASGDGGQQTVSTHPIGTPPSTTNAWLLTPMTNIAPATEYFGNEIIANNIFIGDEQSDLVGGTTSIWQHNNFMLKVLNYPGTNINAYLTGSLIITGTFAFGAEFVAAILGVSWNNATGTNTIRSVTPLYKKVINNNDDTYITLNDPTGHGHTAPTVCATATAPVVIDLTSIAGSGTDPDGLMYVLGFNISGSPVGNAYSIAFETGSSTTYPFGTITPNPINFNSEGPVIYQPSGTLALRYYKVWEKLVPLMASTQGNYGFPVPPIGTPYTGRSDYLSNSSVSDNDNMPYNTVLSSGNSLRQFQYYNYITTSINSMAKDMRRWQMGIGIEGNVLRAEPLIYWFDKTTQIADLTGIEITNFSHEPFSRYSGNNLDVGYEGQPFNAVGTLDDPFLSLAFRLPITSKLDKIDWNCPFVASPYAHEKLRANKQANNTGLDPTTTNLTISEQDNDVCLFEIDTTTTHSIDNVYSVTPVPSYDIKRYSWATTSGLPAIRPSINGLLYPETFYNFGSTPKSILYRNSGLLSTMCYKQSSGNLIFQTSDQTGRLKTDKLQKFIGTTNVITEYADVPVTDLGDPLFLPILFKFDSPQPANLFSIMNTNPRGYISFKWLGVTYKGFIWEAGIKPGNNALFTFQLLAHPDTDISTL